MVHHHPQLAEKHQEDDFIHPAQENDTTIELVYTAENKKNKRESNKKPTKAKKKLQHYNVFS
jgi:hypothetical protein